MRHVTNIAVDIACSLIVPCVVVAIILAVHYLAR